MLGSLQQLAWACKFAFGTLWWVGENLWGALLPREGENSYVQRRDRHAHPGLCTLKTSGAIHAVVPMMYGSHRRVEGGFPVALGGVADGITHFGAFAPVPIGLDCFAKRDHFAKDRCAEEKFEKNHVVMFDRKRILDPGEVVALEKYMMKRFRVEA